MLHARAGGAAFHVLLSPLKPHSCNALTTNKSFVFLWIDALQWHDKNLIMLIIPTMQILHTSMNRARELLWGLLRTTWQGSQPASLFLSPEPSIDAASSTRAKCRWYALLQLTHRQSQLMHRQTIIRDCRSFRVSSVSSTPHTKLHACISSTMSHITRTESQTVLLASTFHFRTRYTDRSS